MYCTEGTHKNFAKLRRKQLCWSFFLIKLQLYRPVKSDSKKCFLVNFAKLLRTAFCKELRRATASDYKQVFSNSFATIKTHRKTHGTRLFFSNVAALELQLYQKAIFNAAVSL